MANPIQGYFDSTSFTLDGNGFPIWNMAVGSAFQAKFASVILGNGASDLALAGFQVVKKTGMTVTVKPYFICKNGYMAWQTAETDITFTSSVSEQVFYIGFRLDLVNNHFLHDDVYYYTTFDSATDVASCKLTITANAVAITDGMIEDLRYNTAYCGAIDQGRQSLQLLYDEYLDKINALDLETATGIGAVSYSTAQTLTSGEKAQACDNIAAISTASQTISDANKTQARANISAAKAVGGVADAIEAAVVINAQTDNYTAALTDLGKDIWITSASNKTLTIPLQSSVTWVDKSYFFVTRGGTGTLTIAGASGVTVNSAGGRLKVAEQYGTVMCRRTAENVWLITGDMSA